MKFIMPGEHAFGDPWTHAVMEAEAWSELSQRAQTEEEYSACSSNVSECLVELQWLEKREVPDAS